MSDLSIREARAGDLEAIIRLHEEDELGSHGDVWSPETKAAYEAAFAAIERSPENRLFVAVDGNEIVGTFQLTFIPNLTGRGALRVKVESVKVKAARRSGGIGAKMMAFAEDHARTNGAAMLELTSNKTRTDAHRFHEGFKKKF
jgi:GNAT superfamily N-acetyltransferase